MPRRSTLPPPPLRAALAAVRDAAASPVHAPASPQRQPQPPAPRSPPPQPPQVSHALKPSQAWAALRAIAAALRGDARQELHALLREAGALAIAADAPSVAEAVAATRRRHVEEEAATASEQQRRDALFASFAAVREEVLQLADSVRSKEVRKQQAARRLAAADAAARELAEKTAARRREAERYRAQNEALAGGHVAPEESRAQRQRLRALRERVAAARFRLRQSEDALARQGEALRAMEEHRQTLATQCEVLEQAVLSLHVAVDARIRQALLAPPRDGARRRSVMGRGVSPDVPAFLRFQGAVDLAPLSKLHCELLVRQLWALFAIDAGRRAKAGRAPQRLADFLSEYADSRFPEPRARACFAYNFVGSLQKYLYDGDVELFFRVLRGELTEGHFFDQMAMIAHLKTLVEEVDLCDGVRDGLLERDALFAGLELFFPAKPERAMRALRAIVFQGHMRGTRVSAHSLVAESEDGDQSDFLECVREQYLAEMYEFPVTVHEALLAADADGDGVLPAGQAAAALQAVDPAKPPREVREIMTRALGPAFQDSQPVRITEFVAAIRRSLVHRTGHYATDVTAAAVTRRLAEARRAADADARARERR